MGAADWFMFPSQRGCTNLLKADTRASRANMTERGYENIFCSNMMKTNQDIIKEGLKESKVDIFMENSECLLQAELTLLSVNLHHFLFQLLYQHVFPNCFYLFLHLVYRQAQITNKII